MNAAFQLYGSQRAYDDAEPCDPVEAPSDSDESFNRGRRLGQADARLQIAGLRAERDALRDELREALERLKEYAA